MQSPELLQSLSSSSSQNFFKSISNIDQLLRCWRWIALVENHSIEQRNQNEFNEVAHPTDDIASLFAKGLVDAGITKLLRMTNNDVYDEGNKSLMLDTKVTSNTLFCNYFDGPSRR